MKFNTRTVCRDAMLLLSAVLIVARELNFDVMIPSLKMDKGHHNEAAAYEVKRNNRSPLKYFEPDCFKTGSKRF